MWTWIKDVPGAEIVSKWNICWVLTENVIFKNKFSYINGSLHLEKKKERNFVEGAVPPFMSRTKIPEIFNFLHTFFLNEALPVKATLQARIAVKTSVFGVIFQCPFCQ